MPEMTQYPKVPLFYFFRWTERVVLFDNPTAPLPISDRKSQNIPPPPEYLTSLSHQINFSYFNI